MGKKCDTVDGTLCMCVSCMSVRLCGRLHATLRIEMVKNRLFWCWLLKFYPLHTLCLASIIAVSLYMYMGYCMTQNPLLNPEVQLLELQRISCTMDTCENLYVIVRHFVSLFVLVAPVISAQMAPLRDQHLKAADFNHLCYIHSVQQAGQIQKTCSSSCKLISICINELFEVIHN